MFASVVRAHGPRPAIVESGETMTYAALDERVRHLAGALEAIGVKPGHSVALILPNGASFVVAYFASLAVGGVVVPVNDAYAEREQVRLLRETGAGCVIGSSDREPELRSMLSALDGSVKLLVLGNAGVVAHARSWPAPSRGGLAHGDAAAMYQFSSGSTGRPKRIARTHEQLLTELTALTRALELSSVDRFLGAAPFSHVNGLVRTMLSSIHAGGTLYPVAKFDRHAVARLIEEHRLSVFIAVPFMFAMLARSNVRRMPDLSSLRLCISASAPFPLALNAAFRERFGMHVRQLYGSTETGSISANLCADVSQSLDAVGTPLPGVDVRVRAVDGSEAGPDEVGEIAVKSPFAITAYDDASASGGDEVFRDGYFMTGDLGRMDAEGRLYLVGRTKLLINRGGYKVNPREVEEVLESHPNVNEAVVLGMPTAYGDERIRAVVVPRGPCTELELVEYCRLRIAAFKVPSTIELRDTLPRSAAGKVRRDLLRQAPGRCAC